MKSRGRPHGGFSTEASGVELRLQPAMTAGVKGQLLQSGYIQGLRSRAEVAMACVHFLRGGTAYTSGV